MQPLIARIDKAAAYVRQRWGGAPRVGLILGSGLAAIGEAIQVEQSFDYSELPHFVKPTAIGHRGRLLCGRLAGARVVAMQGRFHAYEGYTAAQVAFPVRVLRALGVELLILANAAGGLHPRYAVGDLMVIDDHVNFMNRHPLVGTNDERLGPRFPDMSEPYDRALGDAALAAARRHNFVCHRGTYIGVLGPNYETRAEIRMLRRWGDAVGMSTVPEVIAAMHLGMKVLGLSTITNVSSPDAPHAASGAGVVAAAAAASGRVRAIVEELLR